MKKRVVSFLLAMLMVCGIAPTALAATDDALNAANELHELGLFNGTGTNADGTPNYALDRVPTRHEAVTMLVRLLGKEEDAKNGTWNIPFTDVADWAKPYVGYAYANGLTTGTSATTFGGGAAVTASQYITFVLRALGYTSGTDFRWDKAWELSDKIGLTDGTYNAQTTGFVRGDVALISCAALSTPYANGNGTTLGETLGKNKDHNLLPEKIMTVDFDAENNRCLYSFSDDKYYADFEATNGMLITSDNFFRSSSGEEAIVEYLAAMEDFFGSIGAEWTYGRSGGLYVETGYFAIVDDNEYSARIFLNKPDDKWVGDTNAWINFIAYVTNKDVARAVYGICSEKMILADNGYTGPMSAELVEKYGGTLISDEGERGDDDLFRVATISVAGYNVRIRYVSETDGFLRFDGYIFFVDF